MIASKWSAISKGRLFKKQAVMKKHFTFSLGVASNKKIIFMFDSTTNGQCLNADGRLEQSITATTKIKLSERMISLEMSN